MATKSSLRSPAVDLAQSAPADDDPCSPLTRRRGECLIAAIREAALTVLADVGFDRLTMDLVAERAQTSKPVLYRRWANKTDLIVDALEQSIGARPWPGPDTGALRSDLLALLTDAAAFLRTRDGNMSVRLALEVGVSPMLRKTSGNSVWNMGRARVLDAIARAVERGEARPDAGSEEAASIGISLLFLHAVGECRRLTRKDLEAIVDNAWLPALRA